VGSIGSIGGTGAIAGVASSMVVAMVVTALGAR
jgi:hypothetical protein